MENNSVPFLVFESVISRLELTIKRMWVICLILIMLLFASNVGWLLYESQFEDVKITQESDTGSNSFIGHDEDIIYGEADDKN